MEDGVKEDPARPKPPRFLGKAGWVKKATSRLLGSYKDRYVHVEKTDIAVYENEDLKTCLERLDLENYDRCLELRSAFKKKNRLVLIRAPRSGNKVHDVKFQTQTPEERDAWITALRDGISRAKNKIFDEVKVDESNNLEHVTRTRPKGNRNRRPPTRIHMKEVASESSDGMLRLDLDVPDAPMPNGNHYANVDTTETPKEATGLPMPNAAEEEQLGLSGEEEPQTESEPSPQKKVLKPPMPPSKEAKPITAPEDEPPKEDGPEEKVLKPPMPPSKGTKPSASPVEEPTKEASTDNVSEKSPDARKKTEPQPNPPNKPVSNSTVNLAEASQSRPENQPPTPPSKDSKPSRPAVELSQEVAPLNLDGTSDENNDKEDGDKEKTLETVNEMKPSLSVSKEALCDTKEDPMITDPTESTSAEGHPKVSEPEESEESAFSSGTDNASNNEPQMSSQELFNKSPGPPTPKKKPVKLCPPKAAAPSEQCQTRIEPPEETPGAEEVLKLPLESKNDFPVANSPLLCRSHADKKEKAEEKSVDSGRHSDDDSEGSEAEDTLAASTAALSGSCAGLDVLDVSEDDMESPDSLEQITDDEPQATTQVQVSSKMQSTRPIVPLKPSSKAKSASFGDLLSEYAGCAQMRQPTRGEASGDDVANLESEVAAELEETGELLSSVSQKQGGGAGEGLPEDLLAEAMEKLKRADHFLREVKKLKESKLKEDARKRHSW